MQNKSITPADKAKLSLIISSFGKDGLPLPFVKEIFLMNTIIAGTSYKKIDSIYETLKIDDILIFKREPDNKYDNLAIEILTKDLTPLGYVPKEKNEILARLMDAGKLIFGKLKSKEKINSWHKIEIQVYMRDI